MRTAAVVGTGLIGSSIGIALRTQGWTVSGWDPDPMHREGALSVGAVDHTTDAIDGALLDAELVVLAGPTDATLETLRRLDTEALVIDVAGVKAPIVSAGAALAHFVGTHPMAGSESSGPAAASGSLFRGASWVVVSDGASETDLATVSDIIGSLGATPVVMTAAEHDSAVALASHLPHLTAGALVDAVASSPAALALAAGGFRDLTRVAMSQADWWPDVLHENREAVIEVVRALAGRLEEVVADLESGERSLLRDRLAASAAVRRSMAAPVATVRLVLEDRPGQMALVGAALSASGVDLRDLQLRHAVHGGGGVLTLSVRPDEAVALEEALRMQGFQLLDRAGEST